MKKITVRELIPIISGFLLILLAIGCLLLVQHTFLFAFGAGFFAVVGIEMLCNGVNDLQDE